MWYNLSNTPISDCLGFVIEAKGRIIMAIAQDVFYIPEDIATGLAIGTYRRIGSVVRYSSGPNKGQIVKHLKPIELEAAEEAQSLGAKALQFAAQHKKGIGIFVVGVLTLGTFWWGYTKWKNREPKELKEFRVSLKIYIEAIKSGTMDVDKIECLLKAIDALKKHENYEDIVIQLSIDQIEVLVSRIHDYTIKLAEANDIKLFSEELITNQTVIINLSSCLLAQRRIFAEAV